MPRPTMVPRVGRGTRTSKPGGHQTEARVLPLPLPASVDIVRCTRLVSSSKGMHGGRPAVREQHPNHRPASGPVGGVDAPAMGFDDGVHDGKAEARPARPGGSGRVGRRNRSNACGRNSSGKPGPASMTSTITSSPSAWARTVTAVSGGATRRALSTRLSTAWREDVPVTVELRWRPDG